MRAADILKLTPAGLYCEAGDFYLDPVRKSPRAVITHGHSDHARAGHGAVLATAETLAVMEVRYGPKFAGARQAARFNETIAMGDARVTLKPAGHVLGSAQVLIEVKGARVVLSGDYKRARDPTCPAFEPVPCDVFITEATFGLPIFRHPPAEVEVAKLLHSLTLFPERAHFVGAYSLGKAQRLIALLREAGHHDSIFVDPATERLCAVYEAHQVALGALRPLAGQSPNALAGKIVIAPPSARTDLFAEAENEPITSFASGWMRVRKRARQGGGELPLIISDHADWDELTATAREIAPGELWITHGEEAALVHWAKSIGMSARPLALKGYGDEEAQHE
ncbi:MAG: ligase-associated DNA damage response exonuclease [Alphaproteobacteria bacterium]|nr:ligase-associated DNA damage response exonuclease [Alphaproteobacteria bacterium]